MADKINEIFENIKNLVTSIGVNDIADILIITLVVFSLLRLFRKTRTTNIVKGLLLFAAVCLVASLFNLPTTDFILSKITNNIFLLIIIFFQPEIRKIIENIGRGRLNFSMFKRNSELERKKMKDGINAIVNACKDMSEEKCGALICIEGQSHLQEYAGEQSTFLDAEISTQLLKNIFFNKSPLHDGAIIISENKIAYAGCVIPLTDGSLAKELGTRHRAAVGVSEITDALVIVVSEETGIISIAKNGVLKRNITSAELIVELQNFFSLDSEAEKEVSV